MSFWVILLLLIVGFLVGFAFGGVLYSRSVESVSQDHVDAVRRVTSSFDERARRSREANNSVLSYVTGGAFGKSSEVAESGSSETAPEDTGLSVEEVYAEALQHEEGDELSERKETAEAVSVREDDGRESDIGSMILVSGVDYVPDRGENFDGEGIADTTQFTAAGERGVEDVQGLGSTRWVPGREVESPEVKDVEDGEVPVFFSDSGAGSLSDPVGENVIEDASSESATFAEDSESTPHEDFEIGTIDVKSLLGRDSECELEAGSCDDGRSDQN